MNQIVFVLRVLLVYLAWRAILVLGGHDYQLFRDPFDPLRSLLEFALLALLLALSQWAAAQLPGRDSRAAPLPKTEMNSSWTQALVRGSLDRKLDQDSPDEAESSDSDRK